MNNIKIKTCNSEKYPGFNIKPSKNIFEFKYVINDMIKPISSLPP